MRPIVIPPTDPVTPSTRKIQACDYHVFITFLRIEWGLLCGVRHSTLTDEWENIPGSSAHRSRWQAARLAGVILFKAVLPNRDYGFSFWQDEISNISFCAVSRDPNAGTDIFSNC
jgi:hypothetical protein